MSLGEFLSSHSIDITECQLLMIQLLEAFIHLSNYQLSCRLSIFYLNFYLSRSIN